MKTDEEKQKEIEQLKRLLDAQLMRNVNWTVFGERYRTLSRQFEVKETRAMWIGRKIHAIWVIWNWTLLPVLSFAIGFLLASALVAVMHFHR